MWCAYNIADDDAAITWLRHVTTCVQKGVWKRKCKKKRDLQKGICRYVIFFLLHVFRYDSNNEHQESDIN